MEDVENTTIPDSVEPIYMVRAWNIGWDKDGPYLKSITNRPGEQGRWKEMDATAATCEKYLGLPTWMKYQHAIEKLLINYNGPFKTLLWPIKSSIGIYLILVSMAVFTAWTVFAKKVFSFKHKDFSKCCCGLYGYRTDPKNPESVHKQLMASLDNCCVIGEVAAWGEVQPGSRGVRASFAYPKVLHAYGPAQKSLVQMLCKRYQCQMQYHDQAPDWSAIETANHPAFMPLFVLISAGISVLFLKLAFSVGFAISMGLFLSIPLLWIGLCAQVLVVSGIVSVFLAKAKTRNYNSMKRANQIQQSQRSLDPWHGLDQPEDPSTLPTKEPMQHYADLAQIPNKLLKKTSRRRRY